MWQAFLWGRDIVENKIDVLLLSQLREECHWTGSAMERGAWNAYSFPKFWISKSVCKNDKTMLNWSGANKKCYVTRLYWKLGPTCLFSVNSLNMDEKKSLTSQIIIWVWKKPPEMRNQEGRLWENRFLTNISCSDLFQADWKFYKNRFLIISASASWTEISWLWIIRKVSSLFKRLVKIRVLLKAFSFNSTHISVSMLLHNIFCIFQMLS